MNISTGSRDVYQKITDAVIVSLVNNDIPWRKGWHSFGLPENLYTGKTYRGWNIFWLNFHTLMNDFSTPYYLTFHQAKAMGGGIRKGAKGTQIIYFVPAETQPGEEEIENGATAETAVMQPPRLIRAVHTVFNFDQTYGLKIPQQEKFFPSDEEKIRTCKSIVQCMPKRPLIRTCGDRAYYSAFTDTVTMPSITLFLRNEWYYSTLFHELAHSTGHVSRLARKELMNYDGFRGENYSKEELTAELTAAYLCAMAGIEQETLANSAAYIQGWLKVLHNDKTLVFQSAARAQKAADYILGAPGEFTHK